MAPHPPLLPPIPLGCDGPTVTFADRIPASLRRRQKQDLFLDVGGQIQQVHDLRQPGPGDVAQAGQLGLVGYSLPENPVKPINVPGEGGRACPPSLSWHIDPLLVHGTITPVRGNQISYQEEHHEPASTT